MVFIATDLGLIIGRIFLPYFNNSVNTFLKLNLLFQNSYWIWILCGIVLLGLITGIYPALIVSSFNPIQIFTRRREAFTSKSKFRNTLNVFQFTVSVILLISLLVMKNQLFFVKHHELGFNPDRLLKIRLNWKISNVQNILRDRLLRYPGVKELNESHGVPGEIYGKGGLPNQHFMVSDLWTCDTSFISTFKSLAGDNA